MTESNMDEEIESQVEKKAEISAEVEKKSEKSRTWIVFIVIILIGVSIISIFLVFKAYNQLIMNNKAFTNISTSVSYKTYNIDITRDGFIPPVIEINTKDAIMWRNQDTIPHRVVSKINEKFDSKNLDKENNYSRTFYNESQGIEYYDIYYPNLKGKIIVLNSSNF